jgi:CheY-like chemotaxis protein
MRQNDELILIVDDDEDIRELLSLVLEAAGYRVKGAVDGLDALEQIQEGELPGLILLDLMMPRMDGQHFLKKLRSLFPEAVVIIMSGHAAAQKIADEFKATCCLAKPVELDDLLNTVKRFALAHPKRDVA